MSLNEYISRLESDMRSWGYLSTLGSRKQMPLDDSLWQRLQLARNILGNIETTRNFRGSSLNRSTEEMDKLGDPTWQRLMRELREEALNTSLYEGRLVRLHQLEEKMLDRTMSEKEYNSILDGTHPYLKKHSLLSLLFSGLYLYSHFFVSTRDDDLV